MGLPDMLLGLLPNLPPRAAVIGTWSSAALFWAARRRVAERKSNEVLRGPVRGGRVETGTSGALLGLLLLL